VTERINDYSVMICCFDVCFSAIAYGDFSSFGCSDFAHPLSLFSVVFVSGFRVYLGVNTHLAW
jgi:hypothetical protein